MEGGGRPNRLPVFGANLAGYRYLGANLAGYRLSQTLPVTGICRARAN